MNLMELFDEENRLVSYIEEDGTVVGEGIEVLGADETIEAEITDPAETVVVYIYTESLKWNKIKVDNGEWTDLNGVYTSDHIPFTFYLKDTATEETTEAYSVIGTGSFLIKDDGTWEKIGE